MDAFIFNQDCVSGAKEKIADESIELMVCDPPFGISESSFDKHYKRKKDKVIDGYVEAPEDYLTFSRNWLEQAYRVLKPDGSIYVVSGHSRLLEILQAARDVGFVLINHIIWKFNFGVFTRKKFVTSHYHVLYMKKSESATPTFNLNCRIGSHEKYPDGSSILNSDLEDVWEIKKEYSQGEKNSNKLPEDLVLKMIQYSSNPGDKVCDFFQGNFTTAIVAKKAGREPWGFEVNTNSFSHHMARLDGISIDEHLLKVPENNVPENQGKAFAESEIEAIKNVYRDLRSKGKNKKAAIKAISNKFGRGYFGILNILEKIEAQDKKVEKPLCNDEPRNLIDFPE